MKAVYHFASYIPKIGAKILKLLGESEKDFEEEFNLGISAEDLNRRLT